MNKAFVREPDSDGRTYCPGCGSLGLPVQEVTLDRHIAPPSRGKIGESGWFCDFPRCDIVYFDGFERSVCVDDLTSTVFPKDHLAPICACFGFTLDDVEADVREGTPVRIRELLAKSKSAQARCQELAVDGRCCLTVVQRLYFQRTVKE